MVFCELGKLIEIENIILYSVFHHACKLAF